MAGGWDCPYNLNDTCLRVKGRPCDPGMKGCILFGRFVFSNPGKNRPPRPPRSKTGEGTLGAKKPASPSQRRNG